MKLKFLGRINNKFLVHNNNKISRCNITSQLSSNQAISIRDFPAFRTSKLILRLLHQDLNLLRRLLLALILDPIWELCRTFHHNTY